MGEDKETIYKEQITPLVNQITKICNEYGIPYAFQFALKNIHKDGKHRMALVCNTADSPEISEVVCTMCKVQDVPLR